MMTKYVKIHREILTTINADAPSVFGSAACQSPRAAKLHSAFI